MPIDSSALVFVAFAALALCVLIGLFVLMSDYISGIFRWIFRKFSELVENLAKFSNLLGFSFTKRNKLLDDDSVAEDLSSDAQSVLAMLRSATIVVDSDDEVIRASSEAYTFGVVLDDAIVQPRVLEAIRFVREKGGSERFSLITSTPTRYITVKEDFPVSSEDLKSSSYVLDDSKTSTVTRPNWLTVTVGCVGSGIVVVILEDTSAAQRFAQTRDDFITNVSEQLMSSTRTICNLTKVLQNEHVTEEKVKEVAKVTGKSSERLEHMLEDLLLLMRAQDPIDEDRADVVCVSDELLKVKEQVADLAVSCSVRINMKVDSSLRVRGSAEQIRVAVRKLVENALVYSRPDSVVSILASKSADCLYAVIRVVDRGVGIAIEDQPRVFERFYRSDNQNNRSDNGVGLGLAIAKHVALAHHGSITLWSRPGNGTTVSFAIPLCKD